MYRTPGTGRSTVGRGFAGGIFADGDSEEGGLSDAELNEAIEETERGVGPEHLLHREDQEALALGRSLLTIAKAVGGILNAVTSAGAVAAGDVNRHGVRGALARSLRRAAKTVEQPRGRDRTQDHLDMQEHLKHAGAIHRAQPVRWFDPHSDIDTMYAEAAAAAGDEGFLVDAPEPTVTRRARRSFNPEIADMPTDWGAGYRPHSTVREPTPVERQARQEADDQIDDADDEAAENVFENGQDAADPDGVDDEIASRDLDDAAAS